MVANDGGMLKQSDGGGADIVPVTNNSYKVATEALRGLRPNGRMILMDISAEPLVVTSRIIGNCCRIIGFDEKWTGISLRSIRLRSKG